LPDVLHVVVPAMVTSAESYRRGNTARLGERAAYYRCETARTQPRARLLFCRAVAGHFELEAAELDGIWAYRPKQPSEGGVSIA